MYARFSVISIPWNLYKTIRNKNGYLLSVVEIIGVGDVLALGWVEVVAELPEVSFSVLGSALGGEGLLDWVLEALVVLVVDGLPCGLSEALSEQVFTRNLGNVASISWYVLSFEITSGTSNPIFS